MINFRTIRSLSVCNFKIVVIIILLLFIAVTASCFAENEKSKSTEQSKLFNELIKGAVLLFIGSLLAIFSEPLRQFVLGRFLKPKLEINFERDNSDFKGMIPEEIREKIYEKIDGGFKENILVKQRYNSIYVKVRLINIKHYMAKGVRAFLINVEKKVGNEFTKTEFVDSIQLEWSARGDEGFKEMDLPFNIPLFFVILSTRETLPDKIKLHLAVTPFRIDHLFDQNAIYRLSIHVSGDNVTPVFHRLIFEWRGRWDDFDIYSEL